MTRIKTYIFLSFSHQANSNEYITKEFDLNKYTRNSLQGCVLKVDLEYPKVLRELHNGSPLAPDKIEIKREMLSNYQLKIADLYNIPVSDVKKVVP